MFDYVFENNKTLKFHPKNLPADVYLAAFGQSVASSQKQDDVPGHFFMDNLPGQQSLWRLDLLA